MKVRTTRCLLYTFIGLLLGVVVPIRADEGEVLDHFIQLSKRKATVYQLLGEVTRQTGYLFIYDSSLVNNEQVVRLKGGSHTVRQTIYAIIGDPLLELRVVGHHILIYRPSTAPAVARRQARKPDSLSSFLVEGRLYDRYSQEPIPYGTVSVVGTSIGSVTNLDGGFRLHLSDSLLNSSLCFSHLGYVSQTVAMSLFCGQQSTLALEPKVIPLQEVIIRVVNPLRLLREMLEQREKNYALQPVYLTSFYREGVERKNQFVSLTEAVFRIYKTPYSSELPIDQVKLLKKRSVTNPLERDMFVAKIQSGIDACLKLDLIKNLPDFLTTDGRENIYRYASSDLMTIDNRLAHVIYFEQRETLNQPYYCGELYIDSENSALLQARFEINPKHVTKSGSMFVLRKGRDVCMTPQKVVYTVSYKPWNGVYYINHVRGDLYFKVKKKRLFKSFTLHTWFEMATCSVDTEQVSRFTRKEKLSTHTIFADTPFGYDEAFWGGFNIIPPEVELSKAIEKLSFKIEQTEQLP